MKIKKGIIVGLGEVGSAWFKVLSDNNTLDITGIDSVKGNIRREADNEGDGETVLNICIPFIEGFDKISADYIKEYHPSLVVVNTSCEVGLTRKVYDLTRVPMAHIPVRGVHPNIDRGIKTFVNAIGPVDKLSGKLAEEYLDFLGIKHETFNNPEETEMAKLLDTSYYGWNILFAKQVLELCNEYKLNFDNVYARFNQTYNEGYTQLNKKNVIRPVLIPPQIFNKRIGLKDNKINGHCVRTNLEILSGMKKSKNIKFIDYAINMDDL
jgi:hypothetical protein